MKRIPLMILPVLLFAGCLGKDLASVPTAEPLKGAKATEQQWQKLELAGNVWALDEFYYKKPNESWTRYDNVHTICYFTTAGEVYGFENWAVPVPDNDGYSPQLGGVYEQAISSRWSFDSERSLLTYSGTEYEVLDIDTENRTFYLLYNPVKKDLFSAGWYMLYKFVPASEEMESWMKSTNFRPPVM